MPARKLKIMRTLVKMERSQKRRQNRSKRLSPRRKRTPRRKPRRKSRRKPRRRPVQRMQQDRMLGRNRNRMLMVQEMLIQSPSRSLSRKKRSQQKIGSKTLRSMMRRKQRLWMRKRSLSMRTRSLSLLFLAMRMKTRT